MNRRQQKKKKAQAFTIILGCTAFCKVEQYEKMRKSVEASVMAIKKRLIELQERIVARESEAVEND